MFRVGQTVTLKQGSLTRRYSARHGDKATVTRETYPDGSWHVGDAIDVVWLKSIQHDGAYSACDFEPAGEQQLEFSFMSDGANS